MRVYDLVMVVIFFVYRFEKIMLEKKFFLSGDEVKIILKEFGFEEFYFGKGFVFLRNQDVVVLVFFCESFVIDVIFVIGEVSDVFEVIVYYDRKFNVFIFEVFFVNDIEYEGNIGVEFVIISFESGEFESVFVFGDFREEEDGIYFVIDKDIFQRWKESGKFDVCLICGGELLWRGKKVICLDCGYGVKVVEE